MDIAFEKYTLSNGLDVILHVDRSIPVAAVNLWYHVGSQNEEPDRTGFAHLFEHLMLECRQSYKNRPYGLASQEIRKALFPPNHPYNWQTIGSQEHLTAASLEDVQ